MYSVSSLKRDRQDISLSEVLDSWRQWLREQDRSAETIKKYLQAIAHFLEWYEREERMPLQLMALTPIVLIGYRNELQHERHKWFLRKIAKRSTLMHHMYVFHLHLCFEQKYSASVRTQAMPLAEQPSF